MGALGSVYVQVGGRSGDGKEGAGGRERGGE